jgi:Gas vesicle synthesis protein GvpL/GvpF
VIELYAITDDPAPPDPPLRAISCDGLTALCAPADPGEREPTVDALWHHEEVVEALMEERDLLPVRFGTLVSDEAAAVRAVADRRDELAARLDRVRGAVELAVRAHPRVPDEAPDAATGMDYMQAKARSMETASLLHEPLDFLARDSVVQHGAELLKAAYLVDREAVEAFVSLVERLGQVHPGLDLVCTGPWPPYSFAQS